MSEEIKSAVKTLTDAFKQDDDFRYAYQSNIAMAYIDNERWYKEKTGKVYLNRTDKHAIANQAADYFLTQLEK